MGYRITLGRWLIYLGKLIQALAVMIMRSNDLIEFGSQTYRRSDTVDSWSRRDFVDTGLIPCEKAILEDIPVKKGNLLVLGMGGGREAIPLAKMGFRVTGLDFIEDTVERAMENARKYGVEIEGLVQEISKIDVPANFYDLVWLCSTMYSCVPTRKKRVAMLQKIHNALKPGGYFVCQFHWNSYTRFNPKVELVKRIFSYLTLGNLRYEKGDILWLNMEFIHIFYSEDILKSEFEESDFEIIKIYTPDDNVRGQAILRRKA